MTAVLAALSAFGVAAVFAGQLLGQHRRRRRPHALAWGIALGLFAIASLSVAVGLLLGWSAPLFAVYWASGALLTVPFLVAGQLLLMDPPRAPLYWTLVGLASVWALAALLLADIGGTALAAATAGGTVPVGEDVLGADTLAYRLLGWFNYSAVVVVVGTLWSAIRTRRWRILLIAVGVVVAGASFAFIRAGQPTLFSLSLAAGVSLMYVGFVAAARPPKRRGAHAA